MRPPINLFLISTPLQLLNAIEAKKYFEVADETAVVIFLTYSNNLITINRILDKSEWAEVHFIDDNIERQKEHESNLIKRKWIPAIRKVLKSFDRLKHFIEKYNSVNLLFVGYYLGLENIHFINSVSYNRIVLLDDGIATLEINRIRKQNASFFSAWSVEFLLKALFKKFVLRYCLRHPKSVMFFTVYKMNVSENDSIVTHKYEQLQVLMLLKETSEDVVFLGQPLSEIDPVIISEIRVSKLSEVNKGLFSSK